MDGSVQMKPKEREVLLEYYRKSTDPSLRLRAHILLLLAGGSSRSEIRAALFSSPRTISLWKRRFHSEGVEAIFNENRGRTPVLVMWWIAVVPQNLDVVIRFPTVLASRKARNASPNNLPGEDSSLAEVLDICDAPQRLVHAVPALR